MGLLLPFDWWAVWFQNSILRAAFWDHSWYWQASVWVPYLMGVLCWQVWVQGPGVKDENCRTGREGELLHYQTGHCQRHLVVWFCKPVWKLWNIWGESIWEEKEKHVLSYWFHWSKICPMRRRPLPTYALPGCTIPVLNHSHSPMTPWHEPWCWKWEACDMDLRWCPLRLYLLKLE